MELEEAEDLIIHDSHWKSTRLKDNQSIWVDEQMEQRLVYICRFIYKNRHRKNMCMREIYNGVSEICADKEIGLSWAKFRFLILLLCMFENNPIRIKTGKGFENKKLKRTSNVVQWV